MEVDKGKGITLENIQTDKEYLTHLTTHSQHLRNVLEICLCVCVCLTDTLLKQQ